MFLDFLHSLYSTLFETKKYIYISKKDLLDKVNVRVRNDVSYFFSYKDNAIKKIILSMKYENDFRYIGIIRDVLKDYIKSEMEELGYFENNKYILTTAPLSSNKNRYNHLDRIVKGISSGGDDLDIEIKSDVFSFIKKVKLQHNLKKKDRESNVYKNMVAKIYKDEARYVYFVLDDITTTGATLKECKRALIEKGVKKIYLISIAG